MEQSLSIILAVRNAQQSLGEQLAELLEVATDLTSQFEILIVDDGSTDGTEEAAYDLTIKYPQVRMVRHAAHRGVAAAIRTGMERTRGDVVFVQDESGPVSPSDVRRLWSRRGESDLLSAFRRTRPLDAGLVQRLMAWGARLRRSDAAAQPGRPPMIRRREPQCVGDGPLDEQAAHELRQQRRIRRHIRSPKFISRLRDFKNAEARTPPRPRRRQEGAKPAGHSL